MITLDCFVQPINVIIINVTEIFLIMLFSKTALLFSIRRIFSAMASICRVKFFI